MWVGAPLVGRGTVVGCSSLVHIHMGEIRTVRKGRVHGLSLLIPWYLALYIHTLYT